jgi:hypothetical protein
VNFSYGGLPYENVTKMTTYTTAGLTMASLPVFTRADVNSLKFNMPKDAFKVKDWAGTGDSRVGLMPTQTGCVNKGKTDPKDERTGEIGPSPERLHRNGALTFQLVKDTTPDSAVELAANNNGPEYGYRVQVASRANYLLAEWTVFWHHKINGKCLGEVGWVKDPPEDLTPADPKKRKMPASGSADPPRDTYGTIVSTTVSTVVDPDDSDRTIRTTVIIYSTGIKVVIDEYIDDKNKVKKVVITTILPSGGGGSGSLPGNGISQALSAGNTVTGYQQTRNSGKLGRVTWHELLAP